MLKKSWMYFKNIALWTLQDVKGMYFSIIYERVKVVKGKSCKNVCGEKRFS